MNNLENFAKVMMACVFMLIIAVFAASESGAPTELEAAQQTALSVEDAGRKAKQVEGEYLFGRRVQLAGDAVCIRTAGPNTRAVWNGPEETLHCVARQGDTSNRLTVAANGVRP